LQVRITDEEAADPNPHLSEKLDPDPHQSDSRIRIRIKVKNWELWRVAMKPQIRITNKELDPYPHPHHIENSDLDPRKKSLRRIRLRVIQKMRIRIRIKVKEGSCFASLRKYGSGSASK
jgi:hypothetical protein